MGFWVTHPLETCNLKKIRKFIEVLKFKKYKHLNLDEISTDMKLLELKLKEELPDEYFNDFQVFIYIHIIY